MNKDHVWIFNEAALGSGMDGPLSLEYHVPGGKMKAEPGALVGSRLWLVVRSGDEEFLYAMLAPTSIELYQEGKYKDDFLLTSEGFLSARFLPHRESREPWKLPSLKGEEGIRECDDAERTSFIEMLERNERVSFAAPSRGELESIPRTAFSDLEHAVPDQLMSVLRTVAFGDISRVRSSPASLSALGGIALTILKSVRPELPEAEMIELIAALDPMGTLDSVEESKEKITKTIASLPPVVDTFLEEVDPDKISPRKFVAGAPAYSSEWLDKTNDAEQAHEQILKDTVLYLKGKGFKVYKTRSFDLFAEKNGIRFLCEIKSANGFNSVAQGEKGIVQLLRYSTALTDGGIRYLLVLQDSRQDAVHEYLSKMADRAGSELWLYNGEKEWPARISNLNAISAESWN